MRVTKNSPTRRPGEKKPVAPAADEPPSRDGESTGPREVIEQAARDVNRGLLDTDLHGVPSNVPGPPRDPERSDGAAVPPGGVDRTAPGKRPERKRAAGKGKQKSLA